LHIKVPTAPFVVVTLKNLFIIIKVNICIAMFSALKMENTRRLNIRRGLCIPLMSALHRIVTQSLPSSRDWFLSHVHVVSKIVLTNNYVSADYYCTTVSCTKYLAHKGSSQLSWRNIRRKLLNNGVAYKINVDQKDQLYLFSFQNLC